MIPNKTKRDEVLKLLEKLTMLDAATQGEEVTTDPEGLRALQKTMAAVVDAVRGMADVRMSPKLHELKYHLLEDLASGSYRSHFDVRVGAQARRD